MDRLGFAVGTRVRLRRRFGDAASGTEGVVIGYYRKDPPAYAVAIAGKSVELPPDYLEAVDDDGA